MNTLGVWSLVVIAIVVVLYAVVDLSMKYNKFRGRDDSVQLEYLQMAREKHEKLMNDKIKDE